MKLSSTFSLNLDESKVFFDLLKEEDFDFKTKDIKIETRFEDKILMVDVLADSILDLKIGVSALIKSLEVIDKTMKV